MLNVFLKGLEQIEGKKPILLLAPTGKGPCPHDGADQAGRRSRFTNS